MIVDAIIRRPYLHCICTLQFHWMSAHPLLCMHACKSSIAALARFPQVAPAGLVVSIDGSPSPSPEQEQHQHQQLAASCENACLIHVM